MTNLLSQLAQIPDDWALVAVGEKKAPYQRDWQTNPLTKAEIGAEIEGGRCKAIGVLAGPQSGGLLFVDHDGNGASEVLEDLGLSLKTLPKSIACTSGREGRLQIVYRVPERYWQAIATRKLRSNVPGEQLELRWKGCQSVVAGLHPETGGYRWLKSRAPWEQELAEAPLQLIEAMLLDRQEQPSPSKPAPIVISDAIPLYELLTKEHRQQWESGVGEGGRDDAAAAIARDLLGAARYCDLMGVRYNGDPEHLLNEFAQRCSPPMADRDVRRIWKSAEKSNPTACRGIQDRVSYWQRKLSVTVEPMPSTPSAPRAASGGDAPPARGTLDTLMGKLQKYEPHQLCEVLLASYGDRLRYNVLSQEVEVDGAPLTNPELFYIELAHQGIKATREGAIDALSYVAYRNPYDPVREYLERVEREVPPLDIRYLATTYLRYNDEPGSLYDRMLEVTLIGAVKRALEPGCKHQTACVLLGGQGMMKTTFWEVLGGPWFDSSLGDLSSKDDLLVLHRSWIQEWGEIDQITSRKHAGTVKAFVSRPVDTFRRPYGRTTETVPRRGILVGSTNKEQYLVDETGNRRFLTIKLDLPGKIDIESLTIDRDHIWAGAMAAYREGRPNCLTREEEQLAAGDSNQYLVESPWETVIETWLDSPDGRAFVMTGKLTTSHLLTHIIQKPVERQTRADQMLVADIMRSLGWEQKRTNASRFWART